MQSASRKQFADFFSKPSLPKASPRLKNEMWSSMLILKNYVDFHYYKQTWVLMYFLKMGSFYGGCGLNTRLQKVKNKFDFIDSKLCLFYSKFPGCLELVLYAGHLWGQVLLDRCRKKILLFQRKQILVAYFLNTLCLGHSSQAWGSYYLTSRAPTTLLLCP